MKMKELKEVAESFEQEGGDILPCLDYYVGVAGATIERVSHVDHLWTILDRLHTMAMSDDADDGTTEEQIEFLQHFLSKWMDEIEPYTVRLECE